MACRIEFQLFSCTKIYALQQKWWNDKKTSKTVCSFKSYDGFYLYFSISVWYNVKSIELRLMIHLLWALDVWFFACFFFGQILLGLIHFLWDHFKHGFIQSWIFVQTYPSMPYFTLKIHIIAINVGSCSAISGKKSLFLNKPINEY